MGEDRSFEPYFDWDAIDEKMTDDFHALFMEYKKAQEDFASKKSVRTAANFMRLQREMSNIAHAIQHAVYTVPMMVHVAGPKVQNTEEDGTEQILQRCKRCGSVLQVWQDKFLIPTIDGLQPLSEDDLPWWDEGDIVAKASDDTGSTMYQVDEGRDLDDHERPCPDFAGELSS